MLKLPSEPKFYDFKPLGDPAKKKPEEVKESTWTATSKPGIEINAQGKLRTNIPENENPSWHASQPIPDKKNSGSRTPTIKWTPEMEQEFREMRGQFKLDVETAIFGTLRSDSPTKETRISELSQQRNYSTPRQSGKSLIAEIYSRYGSEIQSSQSFQEPQKLSGSDVETPAKFIRWDQLPNEVREVFRAEYTRGLAKRSTWECYHNGRYYVKDIYDQWSVKDNLQSNNRDFD